MSTGSGAPLPTTACAFYTRDRRRLRIPGGEEARVEFVHPQSGWRLSCAVVDICEDGFAFEIPDSRDALPLNSVVSHLILRVGDYSIRGAFQATHITEEADRRIVCGGRFRPSAERDRRLLRGFVREPESD
jgi:hypothetical protein